MKKLLMCFSFFVLAGCQSVMKDIFEIAATPQELEKMSAIDVCKHFGYSQWRNQPQAYIDAKNEVVKRVAANEVSVEDCAVFSKMAMQEKANAAAMMNNMH